MNLEESSFLSLTSFLTCLPEIGQAVLVDGEEAHSGSIFWTHIRDRGSVGNGQFCYSGPEKLHKFTHNSYLSQMLKSKTIVSY